jgi:hypothetical protein
MRCVCCDCGLSDGESILKHPHTGDYLDMCVDCLVETQIIPRKLVNQMMVNRESEHSDTKDFNDSL